jgi:hypothetical protein
MTIVPAYAWKRLDTPALMSVGEGLMEQYQLSTLGPIRQQLTALIAEFEKVSTQQRRRLAPNEFESAAA